MKLIILKQILELIRIHIPASCHNLKEIHIANQLNLDFILLSPVLSSKHSNPSLGWTDFKLLSKEMLICQFLH